MSELKNKLIALGLRKVGDFTLHSGAKSNLFWDIEKLFRYPYWIRIKAIEEFIWEIGLRHPRLLVGIRKGGYYLAKDIAKCLDIKYVMDEGYYCLKNWSGECLDTIIIDDVLTTGNTVKKALDRNDATTHIAVLINRNGMDELDGIPIISGVITDIVGGER